MEYTDTALQRRDVRFSDWGLIDYKEAWDRQEAIFKQKVDQKALNRDLPPDQQVHFDDHLIFCEHPHVFTLGKSGSIENLLVDEDQLRELRATYYAINRGGDITYHGEGQIVGYPIIDLDRFFTDIHKYLRFLEEAIILTMASYGLKGERYEGYTGVWMDVHDPLKARKICAMGVRCSRWVTMHGFALNVNTDLSYFSHIIPCGIDGKQVTSLEKELGRKVDASEVKQRLKAHLSELFAMNLV